MEPIEGDCVSENFCAKNGSYGINLWKYILITQCHIFRFRLKFSMSQERFRLST